MTRDAGASEDPTVTRAEPTGLATTQSREQLASASTAQLPARYTIGRRLGIGGMGEVVLATDDHIGRDVAIKRMRIAPSSDAVARFVREARIQARLDHPAIVPVHELGTDADGRPYFVMKRLAGTTLAEILAAPTRPPVQKLLRAFADVCLAVELAHRRDVVHRDLKPANVMLGDFGEVYVLDWGVARVGGEPADTAARDLGATAAGRSDATEVGAILGTPGYIAPEMVRGETADPRSDVFALGCILFEILTGQPLLARGLEGLAAAVADFDARPSVRTPDREIAPELDAACVAATAPGRDARPTARELAERVERYLDGDRDLALRRTLAASHLEAARAAFASRDGEAERAIAMREAGRAIALDPRRGDAADLVGRMMLEPPRAVPRDVADRLEAFEEDMSRQTMRVTAGTVSAMSLFVPVFVWMGIRSESAVVAFATIMLLQAAVTAWYAFRRRRSSVSALYVVAVVHATGIGVFARVFSPFLIAPAIAALTVLVIVVDSRVRWQVIAGMMGAGVLVPLLLELAGAWTPTVAAVDGDVVLHTLALVVRLPEAAIVFAIFVVALVASAGVIARRIGVARRDALRAIELQAWHLRQLVNDASRVT